MRLFGIIPKHLSPFYYPEEKPLPFSQVNQKKCVFFFIDFPYIVFTLLIGLAEIYRRSGNDETFPKSINPTQDCKLFVSFRPDTFRRFSALLPVIPRFFFRIFLHFFCHRKLSPRHLSIIKKLVLHSFASENGENFPGIYRWKLVRTNGFLYNFEECFP